VTVTLKDAMTMKEASKYLALDEVTLAHLAEDRQIPAVKVGNQWVFSRKSLQKWRGLRARQSARAQ
jgi:excisionase family DNA binding protein